MPLLIGVIRRQFLINFNRIEKGFAEALNEFHIFSILDISSDSVSSYYLFKQGMQHSSLQLGELNNLKFNCS